MNEEKLRNIYYVTPDVIKETASIEKDVPDAKINSMQIHVELFHINPILGDELVGVIKQELFNVTTGNTISVRVSNLIEQIQYAESFAVAYELIPFLTYKISRSGAISMQPNNANPLDLETIAYLRKNNQELMYAYLNKLKKYLDLNISVFPEYERHCKGNNFYNKNGSTNLLFY
jgi:hypothetical protein